MKATLFDQKTVDAIQWPDDEKHLRLKSYLDALIKDGVNTYVDNIDADFYLLQVNSIILPVVVANENYTNSYVCSPYGHYIAQALTSNNLMPNKVLRNISKGFSKGLGNISRRAKINSVVFVNNWLSATDTYPSGLSKKHVAAILSLLKEKFPDHAIVFRSLNTEINGPLIQDLRSLNCHFIASRQVFLNDTKNDVAFRKRDTKRDIKLMKEGPYTIVDQKDVTDKDLERLWELYNTLYISHHTTLNPQFNLAFFQMMLKSGFMELKLVKQNDHIEGMAAFYTEDGILVSPLIGFNKSHPKSGELYQLLCLSLLLEAKERNLIWHQSAGASAHKKNRGAEPVLESMAVYVDHLSVGRRLFWRGFKKVINTFAIPFMERY